MLGSPEKIWKRHTVNLSECDVHQGEFINLYTDTLFGRNRSDNMKPILFSTPMVQAILRGEKTQTRRAVKLERFAPSTTLGYLWHFMKKGRWFDVNDIIKYCPYGKVGDILWVRETWLQCRDGYVYRADHFGDTLLVSENGKTFDKSTKWKPSIFMPKDACRIKLEITNIRVERLNEISEQDAIAEGIIPTKYDEKIMYQILWESINGKGTFDNRWVWVIEFKRLEQ